MATVIFFCSIGKEMDSFDSCVMKVRALVRYFEQKCWFDSYLRTSKNFHAYILFTLL